MPRRVPVFRPAGQPSKAEVRRAYDTMPDRKVNRAFYDSARWRKLRAWILAEFPLCNRCPPDRPTPAVEVHHKIPRDAAPELELEADNLEGLCRRCHRSTRGEDRIHRSRRLAP